jgi:hypothetical protein
MSRHSFSCYTRWQDERITRLTRAIYARNYRNVMHGARLIDVMIAKLPHRLHSSRRSF